MGGALLLPSPAHMRTLQSPPVSQLRAVGAGTVSLWGTPSWGGGCVGQWGWLPQQAGTVSLWVGHSILVDSAPRTAAAVKRRKLQSQSQERSPARMQAAGPRTSVRLSICPSAPEQGPHPESPAISCRLSPADRPVSVCLPQRSALLIGGRAEHEHFNPRFPSCGTDTGKLCPRMRPAHAATPARPLGLTRAEAGGLYSGGVKSSVDPGSPVASARDVTHAAAAMLWLGELQPQTALECTSLGPKGFQT